MISMLLACDSGVGARKMCGERRRSRVVHALYPTENSRAHTIRAAPATMRPPNKTTARYFTTRYRAMIASWVREFLRTSEDMRFPAKDGNNPEPERPMAARPAPGWGEEN